MMGWMGMWWLAGFVMLAGLVWLALVGANRAAVGVGRGWHPPGPPEESAEEILKRRYARGEIDQATFERMRDELRK